MNEFPNCEYYYFYITEETKLIASALKKNLPTQRANVKAKQKQKKISDFIHKGRPKTVRGIPISNTVRNIEREQRNHQKSVFFNNE